MKIVVDGGWRVDNFTDCNKTCGGGMQTKQKYCDNPQPLNDGSLCSCDKAENENIICNGTRATIQRMCNEHPCPGRIY